MYEQASGGMVQRAIKYVLGIAVPLIAGVGPLWLLPRPAALNTVFGEPVMVKKVCHRLRQHAYRNTELLCLFIQDDSLMVSYCTEVGPQ